MKKQLLSIFTIWWEWGISHTTESFTFEFYEVQIMEGLYCSWCVQSQFQFHTSSWFKFYFFRPVINNIQNSVIVQKKEENEPLSFLTPLGLFQACKSQTLRKNDHFCIVYKIFFPSLNCNYYLIIWQISVNQTMNLYPWMPLRLILITPYSWLQFSCSNPRLTTNIKKINSPSIERVSNLER